MNTVVTHVNMSEQEISQIKAHPITGKLLVLGSRTFVGITMTLNLEWKMEYQMITEIIMELIKLQLMVLKISMRRILKSLMLASHKSDDTLFTGTMRIMLVPRNDLFNFFVEFCPCYFFRPTKCFF